MHVRYSNPGGRICQEMSGRCSTPVWHVGAQVMQLERQVVDSRAEVARQMAAHKESQAEAESSQLQARHLRKVCVTFRVWFHAGAAVASAQGNGRRHAVGLACGRRPAEPLLSMSVMLHCCCLTKASPGLLATWPYSAVQFDIWCMCRQYTAVSRPVGCIRHNLQDLQETLGRPQQLSAKQQQA
jgi:hypothetical protein